MVTKENADALLSVVTDGRGSGVVAIASFSRIEPQTAGQIAAWASHQNDIAAVWIVDSTTVHATLDGAELILAIAPVAGIDSFQVFMRSQQAWMNAVRGITALKTAVVLADPKVSPAVWNSLGSNALKIYGRQ